MRDPTFASRQRIEEARGRSLEAAAPGLWSCGSLEGLARPCVAIVGTRAATPYGLRIARQFAASLGQAGCCIISGLALGIDASAHEGALQVQAPTIGVLGGGHRHFFPRRNRPLAARILAGGGAILSPYPPDQPAMPAQFLQRNGIVAALADAVLVVEAPSRSGALNTAGWAAGRIPVLAVPGDVDRKHIQGCLALIRDGAVLARHPGDVLEMIGQPALFTPDAISRPRDDVTAKLLAALDGGALALDDLVAACSIDAPAALAALTLLELEGAVESCGSSTYARVIAPLCGERQSR